MQKEELQFNYCVLMCYVVIVAVVEFDADVGVSGAESPVFIIAVVIAAAVAWQGYGLECKCGLS